MYKLSDIVYETQSKRFWVLSVGEKGYEVYRVDGTHSVKVASIGRGKGPQLGLERAKAEADKREDAMYRTKNPKRKTKSVKRGRVAGLNASEGFKPFPGGGEHNQFYNFLRGRGLSAADARATANARYPKKRKRATVKRAPVKRKRARNPADLKPGSAELRGAYAIVRQAKMPRAYVVKLNGKSLQSFATLGAARGAVDRGEVGRAKNPSNVCGVVIQARKGKTVFVYDGKNFAKGRGAIFSSVASARAKAAELLKKFPVLRGYRVTVNFK
jgi:hypothetical protein